MLLGASGWAPPAVSAMLARAMAGARAFNIVVSNIPGPQQPFFLAGCRMREVFPAVPLNPANQGLSVGIISYDGHVFFGLLADRDLDPPLGIAAEALAESLSELRAPAVS
jgi:diacylglycerol O-acyltransferase / wax synthase